MDNAQASGSTEQGRMRILIVDSYPIFRRGLLEVIDAEPDMQTCGEADNARDALRLTAERQPDLMVLDVCLTGESGLTLLENVASRCATVVFSMYDEASYADRVLRAGARAYVAKHQPPHQLLAVIREVYARRLEAVGSYKPCAKCGARPESASPLAALSNRELEVFRIMGQGLPVRAIADRLHLSPKTVESHRENIKKKLGVRTSSELLIKAMLWTLPDAGLREAASHLDHAVADPRAHAHEWSGDGASAGTGR